MNLARAPHRGYSPPVSGPLGPFRHPDLRALFLCAAVPATFRGHTEAPRKASPHPESGRRNSPAPPTKAKGHPFRGLFPLWRFGTPTFRPLVLGGDAPATLRNGPRGPSQSLALFRVRQMNFGRAPHHGYSPPVSGPLGPFWHPDLGALFFCAAVSTTSRGHTEATGKASPHSKSGGRIFARAPHQGYSPPVSGALGPFWHPDLGALFFCAAVSTTSRRHTEVPRKVSPHSKSGGRNSPAPPTKAKCHPFRGIFPLGAFFR